MNTNTGQILAFDELPSNAGPEWVPVRRELKSKEKAAMQIRLYSPCGCGSGKKFKFCCKTNATRP